MAVRSSNIVAARGAHTSPLCLLWHTNRSTDTTYKLLRTRSGLRWARVAWTR